MRHLLGILLLFCILAPTLGTYAYLNIQKSMVRREVRRNLLSGVHQSTLRRLAFTPAQRDTLLRWEHDREFEYLGQMYDVQSSETHGDSIIYWCWFDERETLINTQLEYLVQKTWNQSTLPSQAQAQLLDFYKHLYWSIPPAANRHLVQETSIQPTQQPLPPGEWHSVMVTAPPSPPPQLG